MKSIYAYGLLGILIGAAFQNCSGLNMNSQFEVAPSLNSPLAPSHPDPVPFPDPKSPPRLQVMDRKMLGSHLRQLFTDAQTPTSSVNWFREAEFVDIVQYQTTVGGPCNIIESGSQRDCNYAMANQNLPFYASGSPSREAGRYLFCARLSYHPDYLNAFLRRIPNRRATPDLESVAKAYSLMHRGQPAPALVIEALMNLDQDMVDSQTPPFNRWQLMVQTLCESSAWQVF